MTEDTIQKNTDTKISTPGATAGEKASAPRTGAGVSRGGPRRSGGERGGGDRRGGGSRPGGRPGSGRPGKGGSRGGERARPEFDNKLIQIRRVTRVVAGGRRFAFSVAMVAGNRKGSVGVGIGKAADTATAIEKAMKNAKKNMIKVRLSNEMMIPHQVEAKSSSARVMIMPAPGRGMVAGSAVRNVLDLAGVRNVRAKIISGSKNKLNIARAAVKALGLLRAKRLKEVV
ncbi:MAG: 30S ribosomal protein S5 [Parcubacteria group bacterium GW2011_GWA2_49_16]|nr:MAG: 30S ribosomal protein S5 [Parcubacteria group bacterium GW2011_GWA2_49_16]